MARMTIAQAELIADYFGYSIEIDGDAGIAKVFDEDENYLYDVRLV